MPPYNDFAANGNNPLNRVSQPKGALHCPFLRTSIPEPYAMARLHSTQHAPVETRLSAHENAAVFGGLVIQLAGDISIVENAGTFLLWYDNHHTLSLTFPRRKVQTTQSAWRATSSAAGR